MTVTRPAYWPTILPDDLTAAARLESEADALHTRASESEALAAVCAHHGDTRDARRYHRAATADADAASDRLRRARTLVGISPVFTPKIRLAA